MAPPRKPVTSIAPRKAVSCFRNSIKDRTDRDNHAEHRGEIDGETGGFHFRPYEIRCKKVDARISKKQNNNQC